MRGTNAATGKRLFLLGVIASLVATAAIAIGVLLFGEFDDTEARILATTGLLSLFSLLALPGGVLLDRRRHVVLAAATIGLAAAAFAIAMAALWASWSVEREDDVWKVFAVVAAYAGASSQAAATTSRLRPGDAPVVRYLYAGSLVLALVLATMVAVLVVAEVDSSGYLRVLGATAVANVLLVVVQSVARRVGTAGAPAEEERSVRVTGPPAALEAAIAELERRGLRVERER